MLLTAVFWKNALIRALKTAAQTAVALLGADAVSVLAIHWETLGAVAAGAALVSLLMSVAQADSVVPAAAVELTGPSMADDPEAHLDPEDAPVVPDDETNVPDLAQPAA